MTEYVKEYNPMTGKYELVPEPPFSVGDEVYVIKKGWSTASYGRKFTVVRPPHRRNGRWHITIDHPRFGESVYRADGFSLENPRKENTLFIAVHMGKAMSFDELIQSYQSLRLIKFATTKTEINEAVREYLAANQTHRVAILQVVATAEVEQAPVKFRDYR